MVHAGTIPCDDDGVMAVLRKTLPEKVGDEEIAVHKEAVHKGAAVEVQYAVEDGGDVRPLVAQAGAPCGSQA